MVYVSKNCSELALGRKKNSRRMLLLELHHKDYENLAPLALLSLLVFIWGMNSLSEVMNFGKGFLLQNPSAIHTSPKFTYVGCIVKATS